jgi:hypothetical protein
MPFSPTSDLGWMPAIRERGWRKTLGRDRAVRMQTCERGLLDI